MSNMKMFSKRIVVMAVLVTALSAAVYANWRFSQTGSNLDLTAALSESKTEKYLGDAVYVNAQTGTTVANDDYFSKTRSERVLNRQNSIDTLQAVIDNVKAGDDAKAEALKTLGELTKRTDNETAIEALIKAKGFSDCVAVITDEGINAVVKCSENGLLASETAQIQDIITSSVDISLEKIKIIEIK